MAAPARFGGLERVVRALAVGQKRAGLDVHVLAILDNLETVAHPFAAELLREGVPVTPLALPGRAYWRERREITDLCRRLKADILHTHGARVDVIDAGVARRLGIGGVTTVHGFTGGGWKNRLYERLQRRAFRRINGVVAVSRPLVDLLVADGVARDRVHLVPNGWSPSAAAAPLDRAAARRLLGLPADGFRIGWVGRVTREKGVDVLVDAVARLGPDVHVSVIGDGRERESQQRRATALGLDSTIQWHGAVDQAGRVLPAFDCLVLSSRTEGTPIILFEAMAANVPVVATAVGGVPDVVSRQEAWLVAPEDPVALAGAIGELKGAPAVAAARAQAARARLDRDFAAGPWIERYTSVYRTVLQQQAQA